MNIGPRKKYFLLVLAFAFLISVSHTSNAQVDSLDRSKTYLVGFPLVPGYIELNENGDIYGFPVEIFMNLADSLNLKYEFVNKPWAVLLEMNKQGQLDALLATQKSEEREQFLDFLDESVYDSWGELLIRSRTSIDNLHDFSDQKIGIVNNDNNGIAFKKFINEFKLNYTPVYYESHSSGVAGLKNKEVFALVSPPLNLLHHSIQGVKSSGIIYNPNSSSISFPKGKNKALQRALDKKLKALKDDKFSIYYTLYKEYGLDKVKADYVLPQWLILVFILTFFVLAAVVVFVIILREQVNKKTDQLNKRQIKLLERAVYLDKAMEAGNMGTWVFYLKSNQVYLSDQIYNISGHAKGSVTKAEDLASFFSRVAFSRLIVTVKKAVKNRENFDVVLEHRDTNKWVLFSRQIGVLLFDENGTPDRFLGIAQDITKQVNYENELIEAKQKAVESEHLKSAFLANMSHEIRTPLNAIVGFTELLVEYNQTQDDKDKFKKIILDQNNLLLRLINDVVDFAKIESGSMDLFFEDDVIVADIVGNCYEMVKHQRPESLRFDLNMDSDMWGVTIRTDRNRFKQVVINFIINAFKYTEKGTVELGCRINYLNGRVEVYVKDTGIGIAKEKLKEIFNRFAQLNSSSQGTGLGLAISNSLAEMMDAEIIVNSESGVGSEFILSMSQSK